MLAKRLNALRKQRGFTAQKMADCLNVGIRNYRKYESGDAKPTIDGIVIIAAILEVPVDYLLETGIYGKLSSAPQVSPLLARQIDSLLGQDVLGRMHIHSVADLPDPDFCQLSASLVKDFTFDERMLEISWKV